MKNEKSEISQKWREIFKDSDEPNLLTFYEKDLYKPTFIDKSDYFVRPGGHNNFDLFKEYMATYALKED